MGKISPVAQLLVFVAATVTIVILVVAFSAQVGPPTNTTPSTGVERSLTKAAAEQAAPRWQYAAGSDAISQGSVREAGVVSLNKFELGFPYGEPQQATLTLRVHPRFGKDVILSIERGQFLCFAGDDCWVTVRFDEGRAWQYPATGPADHSTNTLFIQGYADFVATVRKAHKIWVEAPIYQNGGTIFEFDVRGLVW